MAFIVDLTGMLVEVAGPAPSTWTSGAVAPSFRLNASAPRDPLDLVPRLASAAEASMPSRTRR